MWGTLSDKTWSENTDSNASDDDENLDVLPWDAASEVDDDDAPAAGDAADEQMPEAPAQAAQASPATTAPAANGPRPRAAGPPAAARRPRASTKAPASEPGLEHEVLLSLTVTPATVRYNVPLKLPIQLQNVNALLRATGDAFDAAMRHGVRLLQGLLVRYLVAIEAGKRRGKYHLQGILVMRTIERNPEMVVYAVTQLMHAVIAGVALNVRITKTIRPVVFDDELYIGGYVQKDFGLSHHDERAAGYDAAWKERAIRVYRSKAGSNTYSSDKINKHPEKDRRAVPLNSANVLDVGRSFLLKEGLRALLPVASVAVRVAWMLQTDNYYLDAKIIAGDKGAPLDEARMEALNCLFDDPRARENVALIRCVLYGSSAMLAGGRATADVHNMVPIVLGLPSREQVDAMSLHEAKTCANKFNFAANAPTRPPPVQIGVAVVVDLGGSAASTRAVSMLQAHGFLVHSLFAANQYVNACGHIAEMTAVLLRAAGDQFDQLPLAQVETVNTYGCIRMQERKLGRSLAPNAAPDMLSDDQILKLASIDNPDAPGLPPTWMPGPGPFNSFPQALRESAQPGTEQPSARPVHIMIVNSVQMHTLSDSFLGDHWLTIAWQLRTAAA